MKDRFADGDKVTVKFLDRSRKGTIVGRVWPACWFVDFGRPVDDHYPFRVVMVLDTNVKECRKKKSSP